MAVMGKFLYSYCTCIRTSTVRYVYNIYNKK